jgi:ribosomal protein S18 acetylase RimI-like enzyme
MASARREKVSIRPLREGELDTMRRVWKAAGLSYRPRGRDSLRNLARQRRNAPGYFLGAFRNGRLIGVSLVTDDGRKGWINRLAVVPEEQRKGVASLLVDRSEAVLRRKGLQLLCAHIEIQNAVSVAFFEKLGYNVEREILYLTKRDDKDF